MTTDKQDGSEPGISSEPLPTEASSSRAGLSNDYLNHYVEVLMLIEMAPHDPSLSADLADWWPISYLEWFSASSLERAAEARAAYEGLLGDRRRRFERHLAVMETLATMAAFALQPPCAPERASVVVDVAAPVLRRMISAASAFLDSDGRQLPDEPAVNEAERVIDAILGIGQDPSAAEIGSHAKTGDGYAVDVPADTRILVVEDDALLRDLYQRALQRAGYQVLTAATGEAALGILREWGERIDWLFTDIRLPGEINGWVVGSEFSLNHPLRPIVYGSGYDLDDSRQVANSVYLRKPINLGELVAAFQGMDAAYQRLMGDRT